jgi:hypothetical protein
VRAGAAASFSLSSAPLGTDGTSSLIERRAQDSTGLLLSGGKRALKVGIRLLRSFMLLGKNSISS